MGDVPFTVYFDLETTTRDNIFKDPTFYPSLNLDKIVIFRGFQQKANEIYNLDYFREHISYFDGVTFQQLKDAATSVSVREKYVTV